MPPKRKGSAKQADKGKGKAKQPKQEGQKAVSRDIDVPIDEGFNEGGAYHFKIVVSGTEIYRSRHQGLRGR